MAEGLRRRKTQGAVRINVLFLSFAFSSRLLFLILFNFDIPVFMMMLSLLSNYGRVLD